MLPIISCNLCSQQRNLIPSPRLSERSLQPSEQGLYCFTFFRKSQDRDHIENPQMILEYRPSQHDPIYGVEAFGGNNNLSKLSVVTIIFFTLNKQAKLIQ